MNGPSLTFGPFELSTDGLLRKAGREVRTAAKPLALLDYLVRNRDRFVARSELTEVIWPGMHVGQSAFASVVRDLRRALNDNAQDERFIATRRGMGFRFVHEVREIVTDPAGRSKWDELAGHFERALEALDAIGTSRGATRETATPRQRGALLVALARARWGAGATENARAGFLDALALARRLGDSEMFAQAALGFAGRSDASLGVNDDAVALLEEALSLLGEEDDALRSEVLARLGTELYREGDGSRAADVTTRALAMAEASGIPSALAYALTARHYILMRPQVSPSTRRLLAERAVKLIGGEGPSDVLALAYQEMLADFLEEGEATRFESTFSEYDRLVEALEQPFFLWTRSLLAASQMIFAGRIDEAEESAESLLVRGREIRSPNAEAAYLALLFGIRSEQARLGELNGVAGSLDLDEEQLPIFRAARVAIAEAAESPERCAIALRSIMNDVQRFPRDANWLGILGILAPPAARAGDDRVGRQLYDLLSPFAGRIIVAGHGVLILGAVDYHLGLLVGALGEAETRERHLEAALRLHRRARAPLWAARTQAARGTKGVS